MSEPSLSLVFHLCYLRTEILIFLVMTFFFTYDIYLFLKLKYS